MEVEEIAMESYKIIGLNSSEQGKRIEGRFQNALKENKEIKIDTKESSILLPDDIDKNIVSIISTFEQVSIIDENEHLSGDGHNHEDNHDHDHSHGHSHSHSHSHEPDMNSGETAQKKMLVVFLLNIFFSAAEFIFGTLFNSRAILSDAVHDLGDSVSIGIAWFFQKISNKGADEEFSYGYRRFSLLGALVTSLVLLVGSVMIIIETIPRLFNPEPINVDGVFWVAIGAIFINGFSVWLMSRGRSANEKLLNIHLMEDLLGWIAVLVMSIILQFKDWYIIDPILSLLIAGWIIYSTFPEFIRISKIFLQAVPSDVNSHKIREKIEAIDGVHAISHFHIWSTDGNQHMMSITVATSSDSVEDYDRIKNEIRKLVVEYNIYHVTIELLYDPQNIIHESLSCEC